MKYSQADLQLLAEQIKHYRREPIDFLVDVLGVDESLVWSAMHEMAYGIRDHQRVAAAGCHNSSKTFTASGLAWWWVSCYSPSIVYVTGPKEDQLKDTFWAQLRGHYNKSSIPLGGDLQTLDWKFSEDTMIVGRTATPDRSGGDGATGMQGYKSQRLLMIFDEATGIDRQFWKSAEGVVTFDSNRWLAMANPTNPNCGFRECFRPTSDWHTVHFDALQNPNLEGAQIDYENLKVVGGEVKHPYLATPRWVERMLRKYGKDSPTWESRVRGRFPSSAVDTLISISDLYAAVERDPGERIYPPVFVGVDVARQGDDLSSIAVIRGNSLAHLEQFHIPDTTKVADRAIRVAMDWGLARDKAHHIAVDVGGVGAGVVDYCRRLDWDVTAEDFGSAPHHPKRYYDRRTELWDGVKRWLQENGSLRGIPAQWEQELEADLCGCTVELRPKSGHTVLKLEAKKDMKKRLGHSPDAGDSLALALAHTTRRRNLYRPKDVLVPDVVEQSSDPREAMRLERHNSDRTSPVQVQKRKNAGFYDRHYDNDFYG